MGAIPMQRVGPNLQSAGIAPDETQGIGLECLGDHTWPREFLVLRDECDVSWPPIGRSLFESRAGRGKQRRKQQRLTLRRIDEGPVHENLKRAVPGLKYVAIGRADACKMAIVVADDGRKLAGPPPPFVGSRDRATTLPKTLCFQGEIRRDVFENLLMGVVGARRHLDLRLAARPWLLALKYSGGLLQCALAGTKVRLQSKRVLGIQRKFTRQHTFELCSEFVGIFNLTVRSDRD